MSYFKTLARRGAIMKVQNSLATSKRKEFSDQEFC